MRALPLVALTMGCHAILGDFEVGPTDSGADSVVVDTAVIDTATTTDTNTDTGVKGRSCKDEKAAGRTMDGPVEVLGPDVKAFCDFQRQGGGWTLVAMRASNTDGSAWSSEPAALKTKMLDKPDENRDMVFDIDWRLLNFTEVRYELGIDLTGAMPRYGETVATFSMLDSGKVGGARDALSRHIKGGERPPCTIDGMNYPNCFGMVPMPPGDPTQSYGWVYSPDAKTVCYWAQVGMVGSPGCKTGKAGAARVWVR